jgi:hypothetical protein
MQTQPTDAWQCSASLHTSPPLSTNVASRDDGHLLPSLPVSDEGKLVVDATECSGMCVWGNATLCPARELYSGGGSRTKWVGGLSSSEASLRSGGALCLVTADGCGAAPAVEQRAGEVRAVPPLLLLQLLAPPPLLVILHAGGRSLADGAEGGRGRQIAAERLHRVHRPTGAARHLSNQLRSRARSQPREPRSCQRCESLGPRQRRQLRRRLSNGWAGVCQRVRPLRHRPGRSDGQVSQTHLSQRPLKRVGG